LVLGGAATLAIAQTGTATISGQVADATGAVIPGATIKVVNVNTGIERVLKSNDAGLYFVEWLIPGEYEISGEKEGFKRFVRTGIILQVDQRSRQDITLDVGTVQEVVQVEATAAQFLKPESSELGEVVVGRTVVDLPLNGRTIFELIGLNAGVGSTTASFFKGVGVDISLNGQRPSANNFLIEGMDNIEFAGNAPNNTVQPDAVAEFNVLTNNYSAEYGRSSAGIINVQMRSGTNTFHGSVFEFFRNDKLDATDFFTNRVGEKQNPFRFNQFGGTLSGPIVRNRTFFFVGYQGTRTSSRSTAILSVPPVEWRNGDFSDLLADGIQLYDPNNVVGAIGVFPDRAPFAGNMIPPASWNATGKAILDLYPAPNRGLGSGSPAISCSASSTLACYRNYVTSPGSATNADDIDLKLDHQFNSKNFIAGRFNRSDFQLTNDPVFGDEGGGGNFPRQIVDSQSIALSYTTMFTPTFLNEFRFGSLYRKGDIVSSGFGQDLNNQIGIPGINVSEETSGLAWICPVGWNCLGGEPFFPQLITIKSYQFMDNVTFSRGRHSMKAGFSYTLRRLRLFQAGFPRGLFLFDQFATAQVGAGGNGVASTLVGVPFLLQRDLLEDVIHQEGYELAGFFQDDFRVSSRLVLNLGLRYEFFPHLVERDNRQSNFDPATVSMRLAGQNGNSRALVKPDKNNWVPRFGFSYALTNDQRTVLRGGYGISYFSPYAALGTLDRLTYNIPFFFFQSIFQNGFFDPFNPISAGLPAPPPPDPAAPFGKVIYRDPNLVDSYAQFWNLNIQRELTPTILLDVAYAGSRGVHLLAVRNPNQPPPGPVQVYPVSPAIGLLFTMESRAQSNYHALQVKVNKRWADGLSFLGTYTWSKSMDDSVGYWPNSGVSQLPQDSRNYEEYSLSDWDMRHRFTFNYVWELPVGRGRRLLTDAHPVLDHILGGWQLTGIFLAQSGTPFKPTISVNQANTANGGVQRPDRLADGNLSRSERSVDRWFDTSAFALPALFTFGNSGRNVLIGPGIVNLDLGLFKNFSLSDRLSLQFRAEFFNLTNTPHFGLPNTAIDLPQGGTINGLTTPPRQIQFGLKLLF